MSQKQTAYFGQILTSKSDNKYYRQSNLEGFVAISGNEEIEIAPSGALNINDLSKVDQGDDKFNVAAIEFNEKLGEDEMGKAKYKSVRIFNVLEKKDGTLAGKVACDQIIAFREGKKIKFSKGDWINVTSKEDRLELAKLYLEKGYYDEETYTAKVEKIQRTPDFVKFNLSGKGELV